MRFAPGLKTGDSRKIRGSGDGLAAQRGSTRSCGGAVQKFRPSSPPVVGTAHSPPPVITA
ncbi:hypothetical protein GCM10015536_76900 [Streptomyces griseomycini]|nr:hypothetical protein GCM10015536_76900 [Streptomyces griseomycini]